LEERNPKTKKETRRIIQKEFGPNRETTRKERSGGKSTKKSRKEPIGKRVNKRKYVGAYCGTRGVRKGGYRLGQTLWKKKGQKNVHSNAKKRKGGAPNWDKKRKERQEKDLKIRKKKGGKK